MADNNFQKELAALDRPSIIKTTLWIIDQIEAGTHNWRPDYLKFYPRFANIDPVELLVNVAGYQNTTQVFAHISEVRKRLRDELEKLEQEEGAGPIPPGQIPIGAAPPLPHNYYAVMAELDLLLDRKRHQLALDLTRAVIEGGVPQKLGVAVTAEDVSAIIDDATDNLITTLPYTETKSYQQIVVDAVKQSVSSFPKTASTSYALDFDAALDSATKNFTRSQKDNLSQTAVITQVAALVTLIDPTSPTAPIIGEEIRSTVEAYQRATNPRGEEITKAQEPLENYVRSYISQFLIGVGPIITGNKALTPKDIKKEGVRAHEFAFRKFEEELKKHYTPEELTFFRQNFMQRALGLARLQLGMVGSDKEISSAVDLATPELASISLSVIAGLQTQAGTQGSVRGLIFPSPINKLLPKKIQDNLIAAYFQSEPLSTSDRDNLVRGFLSQLRQLEAGQAASPRKPIDLITGTQVGRNLGEQPAPATSIFQPTISALPKTAAESRQLERERLPIETKGAPIPPREERRQAETRSVRSRAIVKRYLKQREVIEQINHQPLQSQKSRDAAKRAFRSISSPIKSSVAPTKELGRLGRVFGRFGKIFGRISTVVGAILVATGIATLAAKITKRLGLALAALYLWLAQFNLAVLAGALVGGTIGAIAGAISGAILGFQAGLFISGFFGPAAPFAAIIIVPISTIAGAIIGALVGAGVGGAIGASVAAILSGVFGSGATVGSIIGAIAGGLLWGPLFPIGIILGFYGGALAGWIFETYIAPVFKGTGEAISSGAATAGTGLAGLISGFFSAVWNTILGIGSGILNFFGGFLSGLGGIFFSIPGVSGFLGLFGIATLVGVTAVIIVTTTDQETGAKNLSISKIAPAQIANNSLVDYQLTVGDLCASEITVTDNFTADAPMETLAPPDIIDSQVESVTSDPDFDLSPTPGPPRPGSTGSIAPPPAAKKTNPKGYVGQVKWTVKLKPGQSSGGCGADPADQQFLPPGGLYTPPTPIDDASAQKPSMDLINASKPVYTQAAQKTGIPWKMLAGFHWLEGGNRADASLSNGGPIGPGRNLDEGGNYTSARSYCSSVRKEGIPYFDGTYCYWPTLLDSAIWAGLYVKEVKSQMCYGKFTDWKDAICAKGAYNGYQSRYDDVAPNGEFVKGLRNGYTTSYLERIENWWFNSDQNPPFHRYGAYTVFVILATRGGI